MKIKNTWNFFTRENGEKKYCRINKNLILATFIRFRAQTFSQNRVQGKFMADKQYKVVLLGEGLFSKNNFKKTLNFNNSNLMNQ